MKNSVEMAQEQEVLIQQLKEELEIKNKCLSLISHDFKGLFSNILWVLDAYESEIITPSEFSSMLPEIKQNARINLNTINDTFDWVNAQSSQQDLQLKEINIQDLVSELKILLQKSIENKNISLSYIGDPDLVLKSNLVILRFILKKLVENAVKYSYLNGEVEIEARIQSSYLHLFIKDRGTGIDLEKLPTIFTLNGAVFTGTQNEKGVGLSLVIVNDFVKMLNGEIKIYSNDDNNGTVVELIFPSFA